MRNDERLRTIYEVMAPYIVRNEHNWRDYLAFASQFHNQCYGFQLFKEDVEVDSCWGFLGEIRDVQDAVKEHLPEDCNPAIVESLQFQYEELDIDEYLERLQEETEELDCEPG